MTPSPLTLALAALAVHFTPAPTLAAQGATKVKPPPGLVFVEGGSTRIGSKVDDVMALAKKNENLFRSIVCETPQHEMRVDDFFLMVNEVTNEQYAEFVRATKRHAPEHWAEAVIDEAQREFLLAEGAAKQKAKEEGKDYESKLFDRAEWWRKNGKDKDWQIPKGKEHHPVVYVDFEDARAYARWAGLRLPTEFEFQRAGRGKSDSLYPWGSDADGSRAATYDLTRLTDTKPVGSYPTGATPAGVHDLAGNVFEWTASPFVAYPGFKVLGFTVGTGKQARELKGEVEWDANRRVVMGGSFQHSLVVARLTTRRPTDREQSTEALGFRCAATPAPGADVARTVMSDDLPPESRPRDSVFDTARVLAADRWMTRESNASLAGYGVITGYDYMLFVPSAELDATSSKALLERSLTDGIVPLGVFSSTVPVLEPALPAGSYVVGLRAGEKPPPAAGAAAGDKKKKPDAASEQAEEPPAVKVVEVRMPEGCPRDKDKLIFYRADGEPVAWMPAPDLEYTRPVPPTMTIGQGTRKVTVPTDDGKPQQVDESVTVVSLKLTSLGKVSNKAFGYSLRMLFADGSISNDWRRP